MPDLLVIIVLGVIEGITEFLPISSTGHLILVEKLLAFEGAAAGVFTVFIQLGAILAVLVVYRQSFTELLWGRSGQTTTGLRMSRAHILVGSLPVLIVGYLAHGFIKTRLFSVETVLIGLVVGGLFMLAAERKAALDFFPPTEKLTLFQALGIGMYQVLALWPGFSRSGATIAGGLLLGVSRKAAAEFSFIMAVPLLAVAGVYDLYKIWEQLTWLELEQFAVGFFVAFVVAWAAILWLIHFLNRSGLAAFAYYRFLLALFFFWNIM